MAKMKMFKKDEKMRTRTKKKRNDIYVFRLPDSVYFVCSDDFVCQ